MMKLEVIWASVFAAGFTVAAPLPTAMPPAFEDAAQAGFEPDLATEIQAVELIPAKPAAPEKTSGVQQSESSLNAPSDVQAPTEKRAPVEPEAQSKDKNVEYKKLTELFDRNDWRGLRQEIKKLSQASALNLETRFLDAYAADRLSFTEEALRGYGALRADGYQSKSFFSVYLKALYRVGNFRKALDVGRELAQKDPASTDARLILGLSETQLGNYESALEWLNAAKELAPKKKEIYESLAYVGERMKRPDVVLGSLKRLMWIEPENVRFARDYGVAVEKSGVMNEKDQFNELHRLVLAFPRDASLNRLMSRASRRLGKEDLAHYYDREASRWSR